VGNFQYVQGPVDVSASKVNACQSEMSRAAVMLYREKQWLRISLENKSRISGDMRAQDQHFDRLRNTVLLERSRWLRDNYLPNKHAVHAGLLTLLALEAIRSSDQFLRDTGITGRVASIVYSHQL
jgi:hypothetical protein